MTRPDGADSAVPSSASHATKTAPTSAAVTLPKPCILLSAEAARRTLPPNPATTLEPRPSRIPTSLPPIARQRFIPRPVPRRELWWKVAISYDPELVDDLNHSDQGRLGVHPLHRRRSSSSRSKGLTFSGEGMDAGPGIHTLPNPSYIPDDAQDKPVFWLGALGSVAPGTGVDDHRAYQEVLGESYPHGYVLKAFTVAEWGCQSRLCDSTGFATGDVLPKAGVQGDRIQLESSRNLG
ncbi:hypothetical protein L1887_55074 [Cichorium endivia]|nr:hypothetical protein L1887_55074 [Cichorium endivia]